MYETILSPINYGGLELKNRIIFAPTTFGMQEDEYLAKIRNAMDTEAVAYQFAELGKVDAGGGGTIAYIMANYGMEVIDSGVAVLSMHAPWEVTSKADVYEAYKGYKAFLREMR